VRCGQPFQGRFRAVSARTNIPLSVNMNLNMSMQRRINVNTKRKIAVATAVGAAAVAATALAVPAHAAVTKTFHNVSNTALCLDAAAPHGYVAPGANVSAWRCNGGLNQKW
jgi:hypothetical protein